MQSIMECSGGYIDTEERDALGRTVLLQTVNPTYPWPPIPNAIKVLFQLGADVTARDFDGNTCLHLAIANAGTSILDENIWLDILVVLIRSGANVTAFNSAGQSVYDVACEINSKSPFRGTKYMNIWLAVLKYCGYNAEEVIGPTIRGHQVKFGKAYTEENFRVLQEWVSYQCLAENIYAYHMAGISNGTLEFRSL
jgi:ankyrin repeat protein